MPNERYFKWHSGYLVLKRLKAFKSWQFAAKQDQFSVAKATLDLELSVCLFFTLFHSRVIKSQKSSRFIKGQKSSRVIKHHQESHQINHFISVINQVFFLSQLFSVMRLFLISFVYKVVECSLF